MSKSKDESYLRQGQQIQEVLARVEQGVDILGGDAGQLGEEIPNLRVVLVGVELVDNIHPDGGRLGGFRLVATLLQLVKELR